MISAEKSRSFLRLKKSSIKPKLIKQNPPDPELNLLYMILEELKKITEKLNRLNV